MNQNKDLKLAISTLEMCKEGFTALLIDEANPEERSFKDDPVMEADDRLVRTVLEVIDETLEQLKKFTNRPKTPKKK